MLDWLKKPPVSILNCFYLIRIMVLFLLLLLILFANQIAIFSIEFYQHRISPHKNYCCAYAALFRSEPSCSEYTKQAIKRYGLFRGILLMNERFDECQIASNTLKRVKVQKVNHAAVCGKECEKECNEFGSACKKEAEACLYRIKKIIENEINELLKTIASKFNNLKCQIKQIINNQIKSLTNDIKELFNKGRIIPQNKGIFFERFLNKRNYHYQIAKFYSPIIYQHVDTRDGLAGKSDFITKFNYDGNWAGSDNWENLEKKDLGKAGIYYTVIETTNLWFIYFAIFLIITDLGDNGNLPLMRMSKDFATNFHGTWTC